jgi:hypothetical protein
MTRIFVFSRRGVSYDRKSFRVAPVSRISFSPKKKRFKIFQSILSFLEPMPFNLTLRQNKLECFSLQNIFSLAEYLRVPLEPTVGCSLFKIQDSSAQT